MADRCITEILSMTVGTLEHGAGVHGRGQSNGDKFTCKEDVQ